MISALGHCEDTACSQSLSSGELVRLFRCSIHCDRLLCLHHLNAHNILYEEERKQNDAVLNELQSSLTLYQTIFEQHLQEYRQLVHQASSLLLHNTSTIVPVEEIRPILEKLQRTIAIFRQEKVIIKSETTIESTEFDVDPSLLKEVSSIKTEINTPIKNHLESTRAVVRVERIDYERLDLHIHQNSTNDLNTESIIIVDADLSHGSRSRKAADENHQEHLKRARISLPISSEKKKSEKTKKKTNKSIPLKRLQT